MKQPTQKEVYSTMMVLAAAALAAHFIFHWQYADEAALAFLILGVFVFPVARLITMLWLTFSELIGGVTSKILLTVIFFVFLVPIAFLYRLVNKNALQQRRQKDGSYYSERNHTYSGKELTHTW